MIFKVIKLLYGVLEARTHWFRTYYQHYRVKLEIETSTYDPYLLITKELNGLFRVVGMQTDDTLILRDDDFMSRKDTELKKA